MNYYPLFRKENFAAYTVILMVWAFISLVCAFIVHSLFILPYIYALIWCAVMVLSGMSIMFIASLINLIKLRKGFKRLEQGYSNPDIPPVWCPVLTAATNAAIELSKNITKNKN